MTRSRVNRAWHWPGLTWADSTLTPALCSSLLCWLAFPPVGWSALAWCAPIGWLSLVARAQLAGRRPYRTVWLAGVVFWLLTLHWIRLPHPVNYLGWAALASYLGAYLPLFVGLSRVGVQRLQWPLWLVAPLVWTGLDWVRGHLMTGFLMGSLAHSQVDFPVVIQIANVAGEYGVTFLVMLVAACLTQSVCVSRSGLLRRSTSLLPAALALALTLSFGTSCLTVGKGPDQRSAPGSRIALIQGNSLADWKTDSDKQFRIMQQHYQLSFEAVERSRQRDGRDVNLIIWPETMFRYPLATAAENYQPPAEYFHESNFTVARAEFAEFTRQTGAAFLTGIDRTHVFPDAEGQFDLQSFNSSVLINKHGAVVGSYDKMHLVIMGEYVPLTKWFPILKQLTPISGLAEPGKHPQALKSDGLTYCPNICYETAVPHLIRRQLSELAAAGTTVDVLVNLTNDAWFWGSSELDMHLACGIFRAVEMRRPLLIAANGGLSAHVDACGKVQQVAPRQEAATLLVDLPQRAPPPLSCYARWGDWFAGVCVLNCVVFALIGWRTRPAARISGPTPPPEGDHE